MGPTLFQCSGTMFVEVLADVNPAVDLKGLRVAGGQARFLVVGGG